MSGAAGFSAMVSRFGKDLDGAAPKASDGINEEYEVDPQYGVRTWEPGCHMWCPWYHPPCG